MSKITIVTAIDSDTFETSTEVFSSYESGLNALIKYVKAYVDTNAKDTSPKHAQAKQLLQHLENQKSQKSIGNTFFGDSNAYITNNSISVFFTDFFEEGTHLYELKEIDITV